MNAVRTTTHSLTCPSLIRVGDQIDGHGVTSLVAFTGGPVRVSFGFFARTRRTVEYTRGTTVVVVRDN